MLLDSQKCDARYGQDSSNIIQVGEDSLIRLTCRSRIDFWKIGAHKSNQYDAVKSSTDLSVHGSCFYIPVLTVPAI